MKTYILEGHTSAAESSTRAANPVGETAVKGKTTGMRSVQWKHNFDIFSTHLLEDTLLK